LPPHPRRRGVSVVAAAVVTLGCLIALARRASSARRLRPRIGDEPTSVLAFTSRVSTLFSDGFLMRRNRRTLPSRQRTYTRLYARVDRLEDAISHFYNVINELRRRVSTLEKKLKPLAKDD